MSGSGGTSWRILGQAARRLRAEGAVAVALAVAALVPAALVVAWLLGDWGPSGGGPLALLSLAAGLGAVLLAVLGRRWVGGVDETGVAAAAERARQLPEGSLRGVLELGRELPSGASRALFRRSESELSERLAGASAMELMGEIGAAAVRRRARLLAGFVALGLLAGIAGFTAPERARAAWTPLLGPVEHLRGPVLPALVVAPGDTAIDRGRPLTVSVDARLRSQVTLHWRSVGAVPRERRVPVDGGRATGSIGPVESEVRYWVRAPDGAVSDTFRVTPRDPFLITDFSLDVTYPPHVDRPPDHYRGEPPLLRVPEGTRVRITGRTSRPLAAATLRHESGAERVASGDGHGFELEWALSPASSGRWEWILLDPEGEKAVVPVPLDVRVDADAAPRVRIVFPGVDTLLPGSFRQPVRAEAADDHGVTSASLVYRRLDGNGERGAPVSVTLPVSGTGDRASLQGVLDASDEPLVAGGAVEYHVVVRDNSPRRQEGRSATYLLRLSSMADLRDRARRESAEVLDATRRLADQARELESSTRDLSRSASGRGRAGSSAGDPGRAEPPEQLGSREAGEAAAVAGQHEEALSQVAEIQARMEALERAIEEAGLRDPELQRRMDELRELYARLDTPELREQVEALRDATESLDPAAVEAALDALAERQEEFRQQIEQSLETLRRAAAEQELNALAREAEEISGRQEALAAAMRADADEAAEAGNAGEGAAERAAADSAAGEDPAAREPSGPQLPEPPSWSLESGAEQQEGLESEAEELTESLQALQRQLMEMGESSSSDATGAAGEQGKASQQSMQEAAEEARREAGAAAAASGERAASQMADAARTMDEARRQMAEERQRAARESVQQATQEALSLAQRQESLRGDMEQAQRQGRAGEQSLRQMRSEQAALQQGLEQLSQNVSEAGQQSSRIDRQVGQAMERARLSMGRTMEGLQRGGRMPVREAARSVESLNQLAMSLLENDARMERAETPGGVQEALRQVAQAAQEQGSVTGRASALAPMDLAERALTQQLQRVAEQQRAVGRRIGEASDLLGGREDVLGRLDQLSSEAARIAEELEGGRLEPEVLARQERLFHRLLDAGRSLERDEYSDERVGRTPGRTEAPPPEALDAGLLDPAVRYPVPTAAQLEALPPAYRRLVLEYFDRLNRSGGGDP